MKNTIIIMNWIYNISLDIMKSQGIPCDEPTNAPFLTCENKHYWKATEEFWNDCRKKNSDQFRHTAGRQH